MSNTQAEAARLFILESNGNLALRRSFSFSASGLLAAQRLAGTTDQIRGIIEKTGRFVEIPESFRDEIRAARNAANATDARVGARWA